MKPVLGIGRQGKLISAAFLLPIPGSTASPSGALHSGHTMNVDVSGPVAGPVFPQDLRRFDMICDTEVEVAHPTGPWRSEFRESVDLNLMQSCTTPCRDGRRNAVAAFDAETIVFSQTESYSRWIRRSDGRLMRRVNADGGSEEETGYCRPWGFTEFTATYVAILPPKPGAEKLGLVIDYSRYPRVREHGVDSPAFPVAMRQFDVFCAIRAPEGEPSWWPIEEPPGVADDYWVGDLRLSIDLDVGRSCQPWCDGGAMDRAIVADERRITFRGRPGVKSWLDRISGHYHNRRESYGRIEEASGYCQPYPFTEVFAKHLS